MPVAVSPLRHLASGYDKAVKSCAKVVSRRVRAITAVQFALDGALAVSEGLMRHVYTGDPFCDLPVAPFDFSYQNFTLAKLLYGLLVAFPVGLYTIRQGRYVFNHSRRLVKIWLGVVILNLLFCVVGIVQWGYVANSNGGIRFGKPFHDDYLAMFTLPLASYCANILITGILLVKLVSKWRHIKDFVRNPEQFFVIPHITGDPKGRHGHLNQFEPFDTAAT